ncbi:MAG: afr 2 [Actinomycetia bacterium]|nr:afr 2 [Actinomycetes bacterium]
MTAPLRVAVIGTGWATRVHVPAFRAVAGFEVVALCARDAARLEQRASALDIPSWSTDWRALVASPDIDLVSIGTPVGVHREMVIGALGAGKHVLCEKPLATTFADARAMARAAAASAAQAAVCFEYRWSEEHVAVADLVRGGTLGSITYVSITRIGSYARGDRPPQPGWMHRLDEGGGYLANALSHDIDFVLDVFGPADEVCADVRTVVQARLAADGTTIPVDADDTSALVLRLRGGGLAVLSSTFVAVGEGYSLDVVGSEGSVSVRVLEGERQAVVRRGAEVFPLDESPRGLRSGVVPTGGLADATRWTALLLETWLPALRGGAADVPTVADATAVQAVIDAARRSSGGEGWLPVMDDIDEETNA